MDNKQIYGVGFRTSGTAVATSVTATKAIPTGAVTIYITDISASSDVGTATVQIRDNAVSIWENTISATVPYSFNFNQPIPATGTVTVVVAGASASLKTANISGYTI